MATMFAALRTVAGLSIEAAAKYLDVRLDTIKYWNSGRRLPPPEAVSMVRDLIYNQQRLAQALLEKATFGEIEEYLSSDDEEAQEIGFPTAQCANVHVALAWVEASVRLYGTTESPLKK